MFRRPVALIVAVLVLASSGMASAAPPSAPAAGAAAPDGGAATITLVTGDRVTMRGGAVAQITPGPGRGKVRFRKYVISGDLYVIPSDAGRLLAAKRVDERLFDVTKLVEWEYDDAHRDSVPLLAQRSSAARTTATNAKVVRALTAAGMDALTVDKAKTASFWQGLDTGTGTRTLGSGMRKLWLDGKVKASLDTSVPHIGAPKAWQRGLTGKGVGVAVLDTGYDKLHPDLKNAVTTARGFTDEGADNVQDRVGHGTHVASTIAGSGAASDGEYKGVAPGARLAVGKVLDDFGYGQDSWVIAGMQWAARDAQAKVVNMSLGAQDFQGVDPVEQAVNSLTAETGALFVTAAGNSGEAGKGTVGSPASADAALAVGAVDDQRDDRLASFSSRGPRVGDNAVKPEITAPGVAIKAAVPVDDEGGEPYAEASGTSMATPYVAGAAAILAQQHPDWDAAQLKAGLVGSAKPTAGAGEFAQGAGRVDVARAVRQQVTAAQANLSTYLRFPRPKPVTRELTYRNDTGRAVTLTLSKTDGPFRLSERRVRVPAHGTAGVDVVVDGRGVRPGAYAETFVARAGDTRIRTLLGAYVEPPAHELTVDVTDRRGKPLNTYLLAHSQTEAFHEWLYVRKGQTTVRLPDDSYTLTGAIETPMPKEPYLNTLVHQPVTMRGSDEAANIDARKGKPLTMTLDDPDAENFEYPDFGVIHRRGRADFTFVDGWPAEAATVLPARVPGTTYFQRRDWYQKGLAEGETSPFVYNVVDRRDSGIPTDPTYSAKRRDLAKVTTTYRAHAPGDTGDSVIGLSLRGGYQSSGLLNPMKLPTTVTEYFTPHPDFQWWRNVVGPAGILMSARPRSYRPGEHKEVWNAAVYGPALPKSCFPTVSGPAPECATRDGDTIRWIGVDTFAADAGGKGRGALGALEGTATLRRGDTVVATCDLERDCLSATVPPKPATYTFTVRASRPWSTLSPRIDAVYTFRSGRTDDVQALPFLAVRHSPRGLDEYNRAAPGSTTTIPMWVEKYSSARVASVTAEASFDGGKTWRTLDVRHSGRDWVTRVDNPDSGAVSLRTTAADSNGNKVKQTIHNAYPVGNG